VEIFGVAIPFEVGQVSTGVKMRAVVKPWIEASQSLLK